MSKGSGRRPRQIGCSEFDARWDAVFGSPHDKGATPWQVRAEFADGRSCESEWADDDLTACEYIWTEGNYSCDCNRSSFLGDAHAKCGDTIRLVRLTATRNGTVATLFP